MKSLVDTKEIRCAGCGKTILIGSKVYRINKGVFAEGGDLTKNADWGLMHEDCFSETMESPQAIFEEVMKTASKNAKKAAKKVP